jgi:hypothetical protein
MRRFAFVLAVSATAFPAAAHATCMFNCTAALVDAACQTIDASGAPPTVPASGPIRVAATCETCCSPPGGPLNCNPSPVDFSSWTISTENGIPQAGSWQDAPAPCPKGEALATWTPTSPLAAGNYQVVSQSLIVQQFVVGGGTDTCASNADCGPCAVCVAGGCKGLGLIVCDAGNPCPPGQVCQISSVAPCQNQCVADTIDAGGMDAGEPEDASGGTDAVGSDSVGSDSVGSDSVGSDSVGSDSVGSDGASADVAGSDAAVADMQDSGTQDGGVQDTGTSPPPPATYAKSDGCSGRRGPAGPGSIAALLAGGALAWRRRRHRHM